MKGTFFVRTKTNQGASAAARVQGGTRFSHGQQRTKQKEKKTHTSTKQNQTTEKVQQYSFKNARRHSFCTMKKPTTKNNLDLFLEVAFS